MLNLACCEKPQLTAQRLTFVGRFFMPFTGVYLEHGVHAGKILKS